MPAAGIFTQKKLTIYTVIVVLAIIVFTSLFSDPKAANGEILMPGVLYQTFNTTDLWVYYLNSLALAFEDYPWVVMVSFATIAICAFFFLCISLMFLRTIISNRRSQKLHKNIHKKYFDKLEEIFLDSKDYQLFDFKEKLGFINKTFSTREHEAWLKVFVEVYAKHPTGLSEKNTQNAAEFIGLLTYIVKVLQSGGTRHKIYILQIMLHLKLSIPLGVLSLLVNEKNVRLRKTARMYYVLKNTENPFSVINSQFYGYNFCPWDQILLHDIIHILKDEQKRVPSYLGMIKGIKEADVKSFMIKELGYWGTEEDVKYILPFFRDRYAICRQAAYDCIGNLKYAPAATDMIKHYIEEDSDTKEVILNSISKITFDKAVDFFKNAYNAATSIETKRVALKCLFDYSHEGRRIFFQLEKEASEDLVRVFSHIKNPIINRIA